MAEYIACTSALSSTIIYVAQMRPRNALPHQEYILRQRLLSKCIGKQASKRRRTMAILKLTNEDDGRALRACLGKEVPDPSRSHTNKHFHEV